MRVEVALMGQFREAAHTRGVTLELPEGSRLSDAVDDLVSRFGDGFSAELRDTKWYRIFVNGQDIDFLGGRGLTLKDGDALVFLPPMAGG